MTLTELYKNLGSVENARNILAYRNQNQPTATHFSYHPLNGDEIKLFDHGERKSDHKRAIYNFAKLEKILEIIDSTLCTDESVQLLYMKTFELEKVDHFQVNFGHYKHISSALKINLALGCEIYKSESLYVLAIKDFYAMKTTKEISKAIDFIQKVLDKDYEFSPDHWDHISETDLSDLPS